MVKLLVLLVGFTCWQVLISLILWGDYAKISVTSSSKAVPGDCFFFSVFCFVEEVLVYVPLFLYFDFIFLNKFQAWG